MPVQIHAWLRTQGWAYCTVGPEVSTRDVCVRRSVCATCDVQNKMLAGRDEHYLLAVFRQADRALRARWTCALERLRFLVLVSYTE